MTLQQRAKQLNKTYGFNVIPMYYLYREDNTKKVKMIEWQQYKAEMYPLDNPSHWSPEYKALAIMTGLISNLTILDIDSQEALTTLLDTLGGEVKDLAEYVVQTHKGYQLFYSYEPNTSTRISIKDKIDFLSGGVTFAVEPNEGYKTIKANQPKPMPQALKDLIMLHEDDPVSDKTKEFEKALREHSTLPYRYPLQPIIKDFIDSSRIGGKLKSRMEKVFCTKDYVDYELKDFAKEGQIHNSMMYVLGIVASNPTVSKELYHSFAIQWAKKVAKIDTSSEKEHKLIQNRIKGGMKYFRYNIDWKTKAEELTNSEHITGELAIMTWYDSNKDKYAIYKPSANRLYYLSKASFKDEVARLHNAVNEDKIAPGSITVHTLETKYPVFEPTVRERFFKNTHGEKLFNEFRRTPAIFYFQEKAKPKDKIPTYFKHLLDNVIPVKEEQELWLHNLAYHLTYLQVPQTMTIITGAGGTGKGTLLNDVHELIYKEYHATISASDLTKQFRAVLKNKLSVFVDEGEEHVGRFNAPKLTKTFKELVGNSKAMIESKNENTTTPDNHSCKYTLATNSEVPFKFENGDRRTNVFKTKDTNITTLSWFTTHEDLMESLNEELNDFLDYLKGIEVSASRSRILIDNKARRNIIEASKDNDMELTKAILERDIDRLHDLSPDFGEWFERLFITDKKSMCTLRELKDQLGDRYTKVVKKLVAEGINKVKRDSTRYIVLNPKGSSNPFVNK